ncbi:MAG TPA: hypothetical protein VFF17_11705 [Thermoanaerobaculia bacterium]|nr:hypothetical protein [Thermoanaerobaculia bacterium]
MSRFRVAPALFLAGVLAAPFALSRAPEPTPTPRPRLTGGFGKTPVAGRPATRGAEKGPVRLTNQTLVTDTEKGKVSTSESRPPSAAAPTPTPPAARSGSSPAETEAAAAETGQGEAYWRGEARRVRERVAELREAITRLEADTKRLEADYYAWDDGAYRDKVIKPSWDKAREELATARLALPAAEREVTELPDRARRAGALPGWLRE